MPFVSIIITAWREPRTVGKAIQHLAKASYSGLTGEYEVFLVCPDAETAQAGKKAAQKLKLGKRFRVIADPQKGKPTALNLAFKQAKGSILILTDGDVYAGPGAVAALLKPFVVPKVGGVSGRPVARQAKSSVWNYWGHVLADGAHRQRGRVSGTRRSFFPMSGYLLAIRNKQWQLPPDTLVDDAYLSYQLIQQGYELAYAPEATVSVAYPQSWSDYLKQKKRSVGGYVQLKQYPEIKDLPQTRSFWREALDYSWFALTYPRSVAQFVWTLLLFPFRIWLWLVIWWERVILKKDFAQTWVRIESTK